MKDIRNKEKIFMKKEKIFCAFLDKDKEEAFISVLAEKIVDPILTSSQIELYVHEEINHKSSKKPFWVITEKKTGLWILKGNTKREAIEEVIKLLNESEKIEDIKTAIKINLIKE